MFQPYLQPTLDLLLQSYLPSAYQSDSTYTIYLFGRFYQFSSLPRQLHRYLRILINCEPDLPSAEAYDVVIDCVQRAAFPYPHIYCPYYRLSFYERQQATWESFIHRPMLDKQLLIARKKKFCAFLYSQEAEHRNNMFYQLSEQYKPVDALGAAPKEYTHRNRRQTDRGSADYNDLAVAKFQPYKFVIVCENTCLNGYVTEKVINAFLAYCIPIYFGAPDIGDHFTGYLQWPDCLETIRMLDIDDDAYVNMVSRFAYIKSES